ncbi:MAG: hypothetical protein AVDCRST_MAG19-2703 [uncultured Thermomicrobiales bacterium]|uniref:Uncharacterized protein n=1 Tax=uncultured Thermomicrobiales bacterium TaxID=1645740 RepID=A0A6J4V9U1_9BACT|nr:MAG: hypothetical protein AVDCRST_MAG19-2703 [uncultured Thermomicrobiales bacterium]
MPTKSVRAGRRPGTGRRPDAVRLDSARGRLACRRIVPHATSTAASAGELPRPVLQRLGDVGGADRRPGQVGPLIRFW